MTEQNTVSGKELNRVEANNLSNAEFKILIITMLNELRGRVDKFTENLKR